jgi:SNF2 family DNA or RNA helicase
MRAQLATGEKGARVSAYGGYYDILVITYQVLLRDIYYLQDMTFDAVIFDEAAYFKNSSTKTAHAAKVLASRSNRIINMTASPIQNTLLDVHSLFDVAGLQHVLGNRAYFRSRYLRELPLNGISPGGKPFTFYKPLGYKNVAEFIARINPYFLRRTLRDIDQELPEVTTVDRWVNMTAEQKMQYDHARYGAKQTAENKTRIELESSIHAVQSAADMVKLDSIVELVTTDLADQKVAIFAEYLPVIDALAKKLIAAGVKGVVVTGENRKMRDTLVQQFTNDPTCQVLLGSRAIETQIDLQTSAYMIAVNRFWNPTRVEQLVGRIRRLGSTHSKVILVNVMTRGTIDEKIPKILERRAALSTFVFNEVSDLFKALSKEELMELISA